MLGEIVRRVDGRAFEQYVREEIFLPIGMDDSWIGMPVERYRAYGNRIGIMHNTTHGRLRPQAWDSEQSATVCRPGANARGPARELGRFYEMLLARGRCEATGKRVLRSQTVEAMVGRHRVGVYDHTLRHTVDWALGFTVNSRIYGSNIPYGFGPCASMRAFGHGGSQSSIGLADPEHALAVAFVFNGMPGENAHAPRHAAMVSAIYEDLGLE
jgi:CubicO group peptidase (beta-lactamase class C family)